MGERTYDFDANLVLSDGLQPYTGSQPAAVTGQPQVLDLLGGGALTSVQAASETARFDGALVITLSSITVTTGCVYRLTVQGSNDVNFGTALCETLGSLDFGITGSRDGASGTAKTTPAPAGNAPFGSGLGAGSIYELLFSNDQAGVRYRYIRCWVSVSGTNASIGFTAFVGKLP